jgi:hypothetical protein
MYLLREQLYQQIAVVSIAPIMAGVTSCMNTEATPAKTTPEQEKSDGYKSSTLKRNTLAWKWPMGTLLLDQFEDP